MSDNPLSTENANSLINRAKAVLMTPKTEFQKIALETTSTKDVLLKYALPLMLIAPICSILGSFLTPSGLGLAYYVGLAIVSFLLGIASLYALSFVANLLSTNFGGKNDSAAAFRLVAYSWTPTWLAGVLGLLVGVAAPLAFLTWVALAYGLYLFYLGSTPVLGVTEDKAVGFTVVYVICAIVVSIIVGIIAAAAVFSLAVTPSMTIVTYT